MKYEKKGNVAIMESDRLYRKEYWENAIKYSLEMVRRNIDRFGSLYPSPASVDLAYRLIPNEEWTSSFWNGMLWLAYQYSGDSIFRVAAERLLPDYQDRIQKRINTGTHDLGFLYILSCKAQYLLTNNRYAYNTALQAAELLMLRYHAKAGIIQAWGDLDDPSQRGRMIIDGLMNLPLLFWATGETGNMTYWDAAQSHLCQTRRYIIRDDASTFHTFYFDLDSGKALRGSTAQGYSDSSCWSRGQAWGIYGLALNYRYVRDPSVLEDAKRLAEYFINHLPDDFVCYWDLAFTDGSEERDSSAAAIAACGLLELSEQLPLVDKDRRRYEELALRILSSLHEHYETRVSSDTTGILLHGVYSKPNKDGVDECTVWGDYFYIEALVRILRHYPLFW
jgi:unsaturated chondroitin disaccharide hydrolase